MKLSSIIPLSTSGTHCTTCLLCSRQRPRHSDTRSHTQVDASTCHVPTAITGLSNVYLVRVRSTNRDSAYAPDETPRVELPAVIKIYVRDVNNQADPSRSSRNCFFKVLMLSKLLPADWILHVLNERTSPHNVVSHPDRSINIALNLVEVG